MKHFKYVVTLFLILSFTITSTLSVYATASGESALNVQYYSENIHSEDSGWPLSPEIVGEAGIVMDADTGTILYSKNAHQTMYPASVTKLLTTLLVLENASLDEMVLFSNDAVFSIPRNSSNIAINPGEYLSVENCLYGLLLASANEVANALAEHVSGSMPDFVTLMNTRAKELGAINSNFVNANGLHDDNHYTTCYDIATICRTLIDNPVFLNINGTTSYTIPPTNLQPLKRPVNTTHKLLRSGSLKYPGCFGGKTGYTDTAGNTLVTFATRNDMTLICVVMKSDAEHIYSDTTALLDYGFSYFQKTMISAEETSFDFIKDSVPVIDSSLFNNPNPNISLSKNDYVCMPVTLSFDDLDYTLIPNASSSNLADIIYTYKGHFVGSASLTITPNDTPAKAPRAIPPENTDNIIYLKPVYFLIAGIVVIVIIIYIVYLKLSRVTRMRNRLIRQRKRLQRKKNRFY